jgi:hypothetical protein
MTVPEKYLGWNLKEYVIYIMLLYFPMLQRLLSSTPFHDLIMNPEMNNNDRKKHSTTIAMAGIGLLLIAAAFTIPLASFGFGTQPVSAQPGGNSTVIVATPFDTFSASGVISGSTQEQGGAAGGGNQSAAGGGNQSAAGGGNQSAAGGGNQSAAGASGSAGGAETPYVLGGNWNLNVQSGNVTNFAANFIMVHQDGTGYHTHNITDFSAGNNTVQLIQGQPTSINGTADISVNGTTKWPGVGTVLTFTNNAAVMTINPAAEDTDNHFGGQPIYGIVMQATGENGTQIVQTASPASPAQAAQQAGGGNQTGGGNPLGGIGEQIGKLFGGQ